MNIISIIMLFIFINQLPEKHVPVGFSKNFYGDQVVSFQVNDSVYIENRFFYTDTLYNMVMEFPYIYFNSKDSTHIEVLIKPRGSDKIKNYFYDLWLEDISSIEYYLETDTLSKEKELKIKIHKEPKVYINN